VRADVQLTLTGGRYVRQTARDNRLVRQPADESAAHTRGTTTVDTLRQEHRMTATPSCAALRTEPSPPKM
jgi:hypothetical protein